MRRLLMLLVALLASLLIAGCGSSGHAVDAPASGLTLVPGDGIITVSWAMQPGVDYWLFYAPSASISTSNWTKISGSKSVIPVASPFVATGLSNGAVYSFTLNARSSGGPGGEGTPSVSAIPRLAGTATAASPAPWTAPNPPPGAGSIPNTSNLLGLALGPEYVAVGAGGVIYSSPDAVTWTAVTAAAVTANKSNLNAVAYSGIYMAVGDGGVILYSNPADAKNWTVAASSAAVTTNKLNAIAAGANKVVAVGAGGTIIRSTDGTNWTAAASSGTVTTNDLYAVRAHSANLWLAVGAKGTLLTSTDADTWTVVVSNTALDLKGITYGVNATTGAGVLLAVGASGALVTSPDAVNWTAQTAIGTNTFSALTYGTQFIAVGTGGGIFTSTDGLSWASQPSTTAANLNAIIHAGYNYVVVGASGANLLAK